MKISFLIPLYNDEKNITRCIESIENQKYKDIEIIIVNDGSTDNSLIVCEKLSEKYGNIKLITTKNKGVCSARNCAVELATGDYMMFVDSDDFIENETLEELINILNCYEFPDLVLFDYKNLYKNGKIKNRFKDDGKITQYTNMEAVHNYVLKNENFGMVLWRRLYKDNLIKSIKFEEGMLPEDYATAIDYYYNAKKIVHLRRSFYYYYTKNDGLTMRNDINSDINNYKIKKDVFQKQLKIIKDEYVLSFVKEAYFKSLLAIYADLYKREKSNKRDKYMKKCDKEIKEFKLERISIKTKIAFSLYRLNKSFFSKFMNSVSKIKVRNR